MSSAQERLFHHFAKDERAPIVFEISSGWAVSCKNGVIVYKNKKQAIQAANIILWWIREVDKQNPTSLLSVLTDRSVKLYLKLFHYVKILTKECSATTSSGKMLYIVFGFKHKKPKFDLSKMLDMGKIYSTLSKDISNQEVKLLLDLIANKLPKPSFY